MMFFNVHELHQLVRRQKNKKAVGNDGMMMNDEVYKFASDRMLTMM